MSDAVPTITAVTYSQSAGTVTVTASQPPPTNAVLTAQLLADGQVIATGSGPGLVALISGVAYLMPGVRNVVQAQWTVSNGGTWGAPIPVVAFPPTIVSIDYDGTNLFARAVLPAGAAGLSAGIYGSGGDLKAYANPTPLGGDVTIPFTLTAETYNLQLIGVVPLDNSGQDYSTGPTASFAVPVTIPEVTGIYYDGSLLQVTWNAFTLPAGENANTLAGSARVGVTNGSTSTILEFDGGPTGGVAVIPALQNQAPTIAVRGFVPGAKGPWSDQITILAAPPTAVSAACADGANLVVTVTAPTTTSAISSSKFDVCFSVPGQADIVVPQPVSGSLTIALASISGLVNDRAAPATVKLRLTATSTYGTPAVTAAVTGPWSEEVAVLRTPATNLTVATKGCELIVDWDEAAGAVSGYLVQLVNGTSVVSHVTVAKPPAILSPGTFLATASYTVSVTPVLDAATGPVASGPVQLGTFTLGTSFAGATSTHTYLLPPAFPSSTTAALTINVHDVAGPGVTSASSCALPAPTSGSQTVFSLAWAQATSGAYMAQVGVTAAGVFVDTAKGRATLLQNFNIFRHQLDAMTDSGTTACLTPRGAEIIADRVARSLPLRVGELLQYFHDFSSTSRYADLKAGMRLRIEPGVAATIIGSATTTNFMSTGTLYWTVLPQAGGFLCLDAFIGQIAPLDYAPDMEGSGDQGCRVLGLADFAAPNWNFKYWRLIWPGNWNADVLPPSAPNLGYCMALIGANTLDDITTATTYYTQSSSGAANGVTCFFSGQASVVPEIQITVDGRPTWVSLGTTVRQVAATRATTPAVQIAGPTGTTIMDCYRLSLRRWTQSTYEPTTFCPFRLTEVLFPTPGSDAAGTQWDLPLLAGDDVRFG